MATTDTITETAAAQTQRRQIVENPIGQPPKRRKTGAQYGNQHRRRHGTRATLTLTKAPKGHGYLWCLVGKFRSELTTEVKKAHGTLTLALEGLILSACRAELCCKLWEAWGRKSDRTEAERLQAATKALECSERRDRVIERLGLSRQRNGADEHDLWNTLIANGNANDHADDDQALPESILAEHQASEAEDAAGEQPEAETTP
jgi:hypothetical protein